MNKTITLVIFNEITEFEWSYGKKFSVNYSVNALKKVKAGILLENSDYILFWDAKLGNPLESEMDSIVKSNGDLWHIGATIGVNEAIKLLDFIQPTNMLNVNVNKDIDHSSWKHTFKGSLMKFNVFKEISLANYSNSLDTIGLDFGYKAMKSGVLTRYSSLLTKPVVALDFIDLKKKDELLFIRNNFDKKAFLWCYLLSIFKISPISFFKSYKKKEKYKEIVYTQKVATNDILKGKDLSVSIVIATLERYAFLEKELAELKLLGIPVKEIIIIDQTPPEKRSKQFLKGFNDLPIIYVETDKIGQCSARNKGIEVAKSKFVWFLDDDMEEIPSDYLEKHLLTIYSLNADVSCGIPDEIGTDFIDRTVPKVELSNGFPTNDVLVKRELLIEVDGFDVKMDQKHSEDQEIGLRLIKNGVLSVKNNQLRIVHLRAARGGLRNHNVRKITFASSRRNVFQRRFLHHSEIYLCLKHFKKTQVSKLLLLNIRGTFVVRGSMVKKIAKVVLAFLLLPHSLIITYRNLNIGKKMLND